MVSHIEGGTQAGGVREQGAVEDIWAWEGRGNRGLEKTTKRGALCSVLLTKYCSRDQIRMRYAGYVTCMGNSTGEYRGLVGTTEGERPLR